MSQQERLRRQEILHRLFVAFRCEDEELQEQLIADTAETPIGYLEKSCAYFREDFPEPHMPRGGQINLRARVIASVPGNVPNRLAWGEKRTDQPALGPGEDVPKVGPGSPSRANRDVEGQDPARTRKLHALAKQIRAAGDKVPTNVFEGRALSQVCAAIELGVPWPLSEEFGASLDAAMHRHQDAGGDADWWWAERETPTVTKEAS
jgi:hypothetical protein